MQLDKQTAMITFLGIRIYSDTKHSVYIEEFLRTNIDNPGFINLSEEVKKGQIVTPELTDHLARLICLFRGGNSHRLGLDVSKGTFEKTLYPFLSIAACVLRAREYTIIFIKDLDLLVPAEAARGFLLTMERMIFDKAISIVFTVSKDWQPTYEEQ